MTGNMDISAKADYAVRVMLEIAKHGPELVKANVLTSHQELPRKFVEAILAELARSSLIRSQRGSDGGYSLTQPASETTLGAVIRAVDGPPAAVRGLSVDQAGYSGAAKHLPEVWVAVRESFQKVLDHTTLADVVNGTLPPHVRELIDSPAAWASG